jgi:predicted NBD/HSP70 family sugar kinase
MTMAGVELTDTHLRALLPAPIPRTTTRRLDGSDLGIQLRAALADLPAGITAVGIATPTPADPATADLLATAAGLPIHLVRPAQALAAAESRHGAARGSHRTAAVLIDTTLTAAITAPTATGASGPAGTRAAGAAWGHTVVELSGRRCSCGARGCLAAYVSAPAILSRHRDMTRALTADAGILDSPDEPATSKAELAELVASAGRSAPARWVLSQTAAYLGAGIANLVNLVEPDCVVIGGWAGLLLGADLLPDIRAAVADHAPDLPGSPARAAIRLSRLGPDAVALGAAELAAVHLPHLATPSGRPLATALRH